MLGSKSKIMKSNESSPISHGTSLVRCGVQHALFREEQLHYLKQKVCVSGANLEGWREQSWTARAPEPGGVGGVGEGPALSLDLPRSLKELMSSASQRRGGPWLALGGGEG